MKTGNKYFIYRNVLDEACFQHDMTYGESKDLARKTQSDKDLSDKAFETASNPKYEGYQRGLASMVYKFFDKKYSGSGVSSVSNYQLANELHRQEKFILHLETIFGVFIQLIRNHWANATKESSIYCVQLICLASMHGLFLWKTKEKLVLLMHFKIF